jgi:ABC-type multidrug transport system fused ATPase/permease subunit
MSPLIRIGLQVLPRCRLSLRRCVLGDSSHNRVNDSSRINLNRPCISSLTCRNLSTVDKERERDDSVKSNNHIRRDVIFDESNSSTKATSSSSASQQYTNREILQRLYDLSKPERHLILASAATLGITSSITLLLPYACGHVLDTAILSTAEGAASSFNPLSISAGLFALTCTAGLGVALRTSMLNIAGNRIVLRIRRRLFASILSQECAFMDKYKSGDLLSRLSNDAYFIKNVMTTEAVSGLRAVVMSVGSTSLLFYTSPTLAMVSLLSIPPVFLAARMVGRRLKKRQKQVQELHGKAVGVAEEVLGGFKTVQLFHAEKMEYQRYSKTVSAAHEEEIYVGKTKAIFDGVVHVAANGAVLLVLGYGGKLVLANQMTAGDLTGFLMYSLLMAGNLSSLSGTYAEMVKVK